MLPYFPSTGLVLGQVLSTPGRDKIPTAQVDALLLATPVQGMLSQEPPLKAPVHLSLAGIAEAT